MAEKRRVRLDKRGAPRRDPEAPAPAACDCPRLDSEDWDRVESDWSDIEFLGTHIKAFVGVPVGFREVRAQLAKKAEEAGATVPADAMLLLGEGRFRRPVMLEVEGANPPGPGIITPGGFTFSRLLAAPWGDLKKHAEATVREASERFGREPDGLWVWYLTCNECSDERHFETLFVAHYRE
jgi:hypothetical protein